MSRESVQSYKAHDQNGSGANAAIIIEDNNAADVMAVPRNTIAFDLDATKCKIIAVED
jgi:hypothetical protein